MTVFLSTLEQMGFLFTLIALGYLLTKLRAVPEGTAAVLSKLENLLFIPSLVCGTFLKYFTKEKLGEAGTLFLAGLCLALLSIPVAILFSHLLTKDGFTRNIFTYALTFSNFGFMGNAVVSALFPDIFLDYLIFTLPFWALIYLWAVPCLLLPDNGKCGLAGKLRNFVNPMFFGIIAGMILGLCGLTVPTFLQNAVDVLGGCMSPVAMLLTGMTVAGIDLRKTFTDPVLYAVSGIRLLLLPGILLGVLLIADRVFSFSVPQNLAVSATAALAMPLGLNTVVIPAAYGKDTSAASGMALISHLCSVGTIPLVFFLLSLI